MGLFTPKWMTDPEETKKLTDQKKLQRALEKASSWAVQEAAAWRVEDQEFLVSAMEKKLYWEDVRKAALGRVTRPDLLQRVIHSDRFNPLDRQISIRKVKDQALLAEVALKDVLPDNRLVAAQMLTDEAQLRRVADATDDSRVRDKVNGTLWAIDFERRKVKAAKAPAPRPDAALPTTFGGYNALSGPDAAKYVDGLKPRALMELILFGEDGKEANNIIWLCNRLAAKMMIPHELNDRDTIEMFFAAFSGVPAANRYRAMTGFWPASEAESAFTQTMLQFAGLPKSLRDIHARLYLERYGRM